MLNCKACGNDDGEDSVLCDSCDGVFHHACMGMQTAPAGRWHCPSCSDPDESTPSKYDSAVASSKKRKSKTSQAAEMQKRPKATEIEPGVGGSSSQADTGMEVVMDAEATSLASASVPAATEVPTTSAAASESSTPAANQPAAAGPVVDSTTLRLEDCYICEENKGTVFANCGHSVGCSSCNIAPKRCPVCRTNVHFTHSIENSLKDGCLPKCWMCPNPVNVMLRPCNCLIICKACLDEKEIKCCPRHGGDTFGRVELFTN